ncbi:MAG: hypothetical protein HN368_24025 [Spirochaetales bacterium]|nr:hypothetical protein [Spirochaetales bacterium]
MNAAASYLLLPLAFETSLSALAGTAGGGLVLNGPKGFGFTLYAGGGYFYAFLNDGSGPPGGNPCFEGGLGLNIQLGSSISTGITASYSALFGLYSGLAVSLDAKIYPGAIIGRRNARLLSESREQIDYLKISEVGFQDVFPVFYKYYNDHPIGIATIENTSDFEATDISVSFYVKQYMDNPKQCANIERLAPGETVEVDLFSLFAENVLLIVESTISSAEIILEYHADEKNRLQNNITSVRLFDRNATTWSDDNRAAAFVTAKDPGVMQFAKNVAGLIPGESQVDRNLRVAMAMHTAIALFGMSYVPDPLRPYSETSQNESVIDYLQFPRHTFQYRAGDCDDLAILYSSLLEAVQIETAFVTVPGHIYIAFALNQTPASARKNFQHPEDLIFINDRVWLPFEVTEVEEGFLTAWRTGAAEWRTAAARETAGFFPVHKAWELYESASLPDSGEPVDVPASGAVLAAYLQEYEAYVQQEIYPAVAAIESQIQKSGGTPRLTNKLGVIFAKYSLLGRAEIEFRRALELDGNYSPALVNLGNLNLSIGDTQSALEYYGRAYELNPDSPAALLGYARANHKIENFGNVKVAYARLTELHPDLASRFKYLDLRGSESEHAERAAEVRGEMIWDE